MHLRFFNGGYCRQLLALVDRRSWRWVRFHAVFMAVQHPVHGWVVIDTGYGNRFPEATRRWPYRLYRYATPATMNGTASATLARAGIDAAQVRHVIITHFHADHVGGLKDFPNAQIHHHADALTPLTKLAPFKQVHSAFLPDLIPADLNERSNAIANDNFKTDPSLGLASFDLFGDGLIQLVHLPGHAPGHLGVLFPEAGKPLLYATDAFWCTAQIEDNVGLIPPVRKLQWDGSAYESTIRKLRAGVSAGHYRLLACHDAETQRHVEP